VKDRKRGRFDDGSSRRGVWCRDYGILICGRLNSTAAGKAGDGRGYAIGNGSGARTVYLWVCSEAGMDKQGGGISTVKLKNSNGIGADGAKRKADIECGPI
jgi:hypothetical protein